MRVLQLAIGRNGSLFTERLQIALHDYQADETTDKLLGIARFVKLNLKTLGEEAAIAAYRKLKDTHTPIVTHVEDEAQFQRLKTEGVELFQGYYFVNPVISADQELSPNEAALLQLVAELNSDDTDFDRLAEIISTDVALTHQLLAAINHPSNDLPREVTSIEDAVQLMGLKRLKFWVTIMLLSRAEGVPEELLKTALTRGKFMEMLAAHAPGHEPEKDAFFLVGLFSTLNAFFHLPMQDLVDQLPLAAPLKKALTDYEGDMGQALRITKALEQGSTDLMSLRFENLGIMNISSFYLTATAWASKILQSAR
jgi:EAL and modified HD-GYP domain-containing signal transduction protein